MAAFAIGLGLAGPASSGDRYATSRSPLWRVGRIDPVLTDACRRLEFNQRRRHDLFIGYRGAEGRGTTGIAKKGWNLRDPRGLAQPGFTYHFFDDGYSDCRVYVAGPATRGRRQAQP